MGHVEPLLGDVALIIERAIACFVTGKSLVGDRRKLRVLPTAQVRVFSQLFGRWQERARPAAPVRVFLTVRAAALAWST